MPHDQQILTVLQQHCDDTAVQWLLGAIEKIKCATDPVQAHHIVSAMAKRKVGDEPAAISLQNFSGEMEVFSHWKAADLARVLLITTRISLPYETARAVLTDCYQMGDERERSALLMGLSWLDPQGGWLVGAEESCRTNSVALFSAIAMQNPYPAHFFTQRAFNQLVLKSLFLGLDIGHVYGLQARNNTELSAMCSNYIDERVAAGRDYPASIHLAINEDSSNEVL